MSSLPRPGPPDDLSRWLDEAQHGSLEALGQLLESQRADLLRIAHHELPDVLRSKASDDDLVQQTFLEAFRDFGRFRGTTSAELRTWLQRILRHNLANHIRAYLATAKRQVRREVPLDAVSPAVLEQALGRRNEDAAAREYAEEVRHVLERLADDHRQVIQLRHFEGLSFDVIARLLRRSPEAARKLWQRALQDLQEFRELLS